MTCWPKIAGLCFLPFFIMASAGSKPTEAQGKLNAYYTATLLGLPIGHISWAVDLKESRFSSVATGSIAGFLRMFLDAQGSVVAEGRLFAGKPIPSRFELKLMAGKWSDDVGIVFTGNRARESLLPSTAAPSADYVPIKDGDRVGASDPMTALLVYVGGSGATTVPQACERTWLFLMVIPATTCAYPFSASVRSTPRRAMRGRWWCAWLSSSPLPDTIQSIS